MSSEFKEPPSLVQKRIYDVLLHSSSADIAIYLLYEAAYMYNVHTFNNAVLTLGITSRKMQQSLGPHIQRLNEKLVKSHVVPGALKQTYRLAPKE